MFKQFMKGTSGHYVTIKYLFASMTDCRVWMDGIKDTKIRNMLKWQTKIEGCDVEVG